MTPAGLADQMRTFQVGHDALEAPLHTLFANEFARVGVSEPSFFAGLDRGAVVAAGLCGEVAGRRSPSEPPHIGHFA
jgi:hypothetical protein